MPAPLTIKPDFEDVPEFMQVQYMDMADFCEYARTYEEVKAEYPSGCAEYYCAYCTYNKRIMTYDDFDSDFLGEDGESVAQEFTETHWGYIDEAYKDFIDWDAVMENLEYNDEIVELGGAYFTA